MRSSVPKPVKITLTCFLGQGKQVEQSFLDNNVNTASTWMNFLEQFQIVGEVGTHVIVTHYKNHGLFQLDEPISKLVNKFKRRNWIAVRLMGARSKITFKYKPKPSANSHNIAGACVHSDTKPEANSNHEWITATDTEDSRSQSPGIIVDTVSLDGGVLRTKVIRKMKAKPGRDFLKMRTELLNLKSSGDRYNRIGLCLDVMSAAFGI